MLLGREYNCVEMGYIFVGGCGKVERLEVKIKGRIKKRKKERERERRRKKRGAEGGGEY